MTNLHSIGGGMAWMASAALLLLATLEPVSTSRTPAQLQTPAFATANQEAA